MQKHRYSHDLQQIRAALHSGRGAVLVGSGFSFNAQRRYASGRSFPSWEQLANSMIDKLYPDDKNARDRALSRTGATSGILRLAEEFEAAFGRILLLNHVREMLPDLEYEPGQAHYDLLKLPWRDVFTTNYDTLLETATRQLRGNRYEIVRCISDLPLKRHPRLVKLHGTLPELRDCIFTEEDYRTYPDKFGPFVAEVQVAMAESHLCLVGFSGDDPNFLAWSGWVRDRLGDSSPPVYLWTFGELTTFQVRMLEQRAVIPLPLREITGCPAPNEALRKFIKILEEPPNAPKPTWCLLPYPKKVEVKTGRRPPSRTQPPSGQDWWEAALEWRSDRHLYPGWIVPHVDAIDDLWRGTEPWAECAESNPTELSDLEPPQCIVVLFELLWRIRKAVYPAYDRLASDTFAGGLERYRTWRAKAKEDETEVTIGSVGTEITVAISKLDFAAIELELERLRHARESGCLARFSEICKHLGSCVLKLSEPQRERVRHFQTYETALAMLASRDDRRAGNLLSEWDTTSAPIWALRRAGLLMETGENEVASEILTQTLQDLRANEGSWETWSIEAWVIENLKTLEWLRSFEASRQAIDSSQKLQSVSREDSTELHAEREWAVPDSTVPRGISNTTRPRPIEV